MDSSEDVAEKLALAVVLDACRVNDHKVPVPTAQNKLNKARHALLLVALAVNALLSLLVDESFEGCSASRVLNSASLDERLNPLVLRSIGVGICRCRAVLSSIRLLFSVC